MTLPTTIHKQDHLLTLNIHAEAPIQEPVHGYEMHPLFLDPENGTWVLYARFPPGTKLPTHFHTGTVHFFTTRGEWHYAEHPDDPQTTGSYLYEPAGSIHQFCVPENAKEPAEGFMVVSGANINFDEHGNYQDTLDAGAIEATMLALCEMMGRPAPRYIKPGAPARFSDTQEKT